MCVLWKRTCLRDLAHEHHRFGYRRLFVLPRREGEAASRNKVYRLYRAEGLAVRKRKGRYRDQGAPRHGDPEIAVNRFTAIGLKTGRKSQKRLTYPEKFNDFSAMNYFVMRGREFESLLWHQLPKRLNLSPSDQAWPLRSSRNQ